MFPGHKGEQPSRSYHLLAPLSPAAQKGKKEGSCQEVSAPRMHEVHKEGAAWLVLFPDGGRKPERSAQSAATLQQFGL